jgi:hypothetical protein
MTARSQALSPKLLARLRSRRSDVRESAERELLDLGPIAVDMLLRTLEAERPKRVRNRRIALALVAVFAVAALVGALTPGHGFQINIGQIWVVFALLAATSVQRNAARALARFSDKRAVGALSEALDYHDKQVRESAAEALVRLLPTLNASDHALLSYDERRALDRAITRLGATRLALAALRAYEQIGDAESLAVVERMAYGKVQPLRSDVRPLVRGLSFGIVAWASRGPLEPAVVAEARAVLPALRVRAEQVRAAQTLLRPVEANPGDGTLLRPAEPAAPTEDALLVRPVGVHETVSDMALAASAAEQESGALDGAQAVRASQPGRP